MGKFCTPGRIIAAIVIISTTIVVILIVFLAKVTKEKDKLKASPSCSHSEDKHCEGIDPICQFPFPSKELFHRHSVCYVPRCKEYRFVTAAENRHMFNVSTICNVTKAREKTQLRLYCTNGPKSSEVCKTHLCSGQCNNETISLPSTGLIEMVFDLTCADQEGYIEVWSLLSFDKRKRLRV